ncbi:hypothetical protein [Leeuwenhoekiella aequorea]|uniref:PH (Pleckstrin Homology) domain-containing protein n=1 Tax=Leeuwenhoekiella aequorea TaxID=283736 RepID=A0A4Q0P2A9_9FLAO|nr:hypothetical protein [Leeuwenhoekiella aequorea]RXG20683.1 hypothetical protein DSM00_2787 [Leeuwenhoekiella aequorea]
MITIRYAKERLTSNLRLGLFFFGTGLLLFVGELLFSGADNSMSVIGSGQIFGGSTLLAVYYFEYKKQYLTLRNGVLTKHTLFPKHIQLTQLKSIKEFAGDLKLITSKQEFIVNTQIVDPISLAELINELQRYDLN